MHHSKLMLICVGVSGSGKSTLAKKVKQQNPEAIICSADDYFVDKNGNYNFNHAKLGKAHLFCQSQAKLQCRIDTRIIIIDNTNLTKKERKVYEDIAADHNYEVKYLVPDTDWSRDASELFVRNVHGVPMETIKQMLNRIQEVPNDLLYRFPA